MTDKPPHEEHIVPGMAAAAGAMFMFMLMNAGAKYLSATHPIVEIAFYRNLIGCLPFLAAALLTGRRDILVIRSKPRVIAGRAVMGTASLLLGFGAYALMPMAETSVFLFTTSLFLPALGVMFLREKVGPIRWSAVIVGFLGVALMLGPGEGLNGLGAALALSAALVRAVMGIMLRHLGSHENPATISLYFFLIGLAITGLAMPFVAVRPTLAEIPLLIGVGLAGAAAQWLLSVAYKYAAASIVAVFNYTSLVWATLFGWLIWNEWPLPVVFAGSAIVIAANILIIWRETHLARAARPVAGHVPGLPDHR